jgi:hypothetical protein
MENKIKSLIHAFFTAFLLQAFVVIITARFFNNIFNQIENIILRGPVSKVTYLLLVCLFYVIYRVFAEKEIKKVKDKEVKEFKVRYFFYVLFGIPVLFFIGLIIYIAATWRY